MRTNYSILGLYWGPPILGKYCMYVDIHAHFGASVDFSGSTQHVFSMTADDLLQ